MILFNDEPSKAFLKGEYVVAYHLAKEKLEAGSAMHATILGLLYQSGHYVEADVSKALRFFEQGAESRNEYSLFYLAKFEESQGYFGSAAEIYGCYELESFAPAIYRLGRLLIDYPEIYPEINAHDLFVEAADKGSLPAELFLRGKDGAEEKNVLKKCVKILRFFFKSAAMVLFAFKNPHSVRMLE